MCQISTISLFNFPLYILLDKIYSKIEVSELYHIYYISIYNEWESTCNYIEQGLKPGFSLDVIN